MIQPTSAQYDKVRETYKHLTLDALYNVLAETLVLQEKHIEIIQLLLDMTIDESDLIRAIPITKNGTVQLISLRSHLESLIKEAGISIEE